MVTKPTATVQALLRQLPGDEINSALPDLYMVQDIGPQALLDNLYMQQLADLQDCVLDLNEWTEDVAWAAAATDNPHLVQQLTDIYTGGALESTLFPAARLLPNHMEVGSALTDIQLTFELYSDPPN